SIRGFFNAFREAGAAARTMLVSAAAAQWKVPAAQCTAKFHEVVHAPSGRKLGYGELALAASKLPVPKPEQLKYKPKSEWRYIGKDQAMADLADICAGKAVFGMDVK